MTTRKVFTKAEKRTFAIRMAKERKMANGGFGIELKFADFETVSDAFAVTWQRMQDGTINCVSGVAQGDGESQRDGRKYMIHSVHIRATLATSSTESQTGPLADIVGRICLVWDTQSNGAVPTATDIMDGRQTADELSFRNLQNTKRFRILWDKSWKINRLNMNEGSINLFASNTQISPIIKFNKKFKNPIPVTCTGTGNTVASISDNSLHIIGVANSTEAFLNYQVRVRFTG